MPQKDWEVTFFLALVACVDGVFPAETHPKIVYPTPLH